MHKLALTRGSKAVLIKVVSPQCRLSNRRLWRISGKLLVEFAFGEVRLHPNLAEGQTRHPNIAGSDHFF